MKHIELYKSFKGPKWVPTKVPYWEGNKLASTDASKLSVAFDDPKPELEKFIKKFSLKSGEDFHGDRVMSRVIDDENEITIRLYGDYLVIAVIGKSIKKQVDDFLKTLLRSKAC